MNGTRRSENLFETEAQFAANGVTKINGVVDAGLLGTVKVAAERAFELADAAVPHGAGPRGVSIFGLDLPFAISALVANPSFERLTTAYLGPARIHDSSHGRRISPQAPQHHLPFHQDETILNARVLNVWIPLDPCGLDAPGLEVVRGSWAELLPLSPPPGARFAVERARIAQATVYARCGLSALWAPRFAVGDAIVFSGRTAHRTFSAAGMTKDRMSIELRFVSR